MALTRAQLLSGNSSQGAVLAGQVQAVSQGAGVIIASNGQISVDASTVTGLVKLNNPLGYNAYVWPSVDGSTGQFLQTDGAGNLVWATAQGYAVVTVQSGAPSPADIGELWFDCATGTLNVYQNCVGTPSPNWFNVAQPGLPVLPGSTSAAPPFVSGSGTSAAPYVCNTTTVPVSGSAFVVNTVSVVGLAPFQYVPIADLNGVANGGRFSFSNYYADAGGTLTFQTIFNDVPGSPVGTPYTANIKIGYGSAYVDAVVTIVAALTLAPGTITGTPTVNTAVAYTPGVASGGTSPYTYTYQWYRDGVAIGGATSSSYTPVAADVGKTLSVTQTVTDLALATANATTTASGVTVYASIPSGTWNPGNTMNTSVPGTSSATWNGATGTVTSSGCVVLSTTSATGPWSTSVTATNGQPLYVQWDMAAAGTCGDAATGTLIQGTVTSAVGQNSYSVTVNRKPNPALPNVSDSNVALGATVSKTLGTTVQGINATAYITLGAASTGTNVKVSLDGGTTFVTVPSAPSTAMPVTLGQTIIIEQTVGSSTTVGYTAIINVGDSTGSAGGAATFQTVTYTATTVATAAFPNTTFTPSTGPTASPEATNLTGPARVGTCQSIAWADAATNLTSTGDLEFKVTAGGTWGQSSTAVNVGEVVFLRWNATAALNAAATGATLAGTLTNGTYTNSFSLAVVKQPSAYTWTDNPSAGTSATVTSNTISIGAINCPAELTITVPGSNPLTNVQAIINGVGPTTIPTAAPGLVINPADAAGTTPTTIQILGDTGSTAATYSITTNIGKGGTVVSDTWSVTATVSDTIDTPSITSPVSPNNTNLNPNSFSPSGIPVSGSAYSPQGSTGAQTSSTWEVYKWVGGGAATAPTTDPPGANYAAITGSPFNVTSAPFTSLNISLSALSPSSTYYVRTRYSASTPSAIDSLYSAWSSFTTAASFAPETPAGSLYSLGSSGVITPYTGAVVKNPFATYNNPVVNYGAGGTSSGTIYKSGSYAGGALSVMAAPPAALTNVQSYIPFYGDTPGGNEGGIIAKLDGSVIGQYQSTFNPLTLSAGVSVKAVANCGVTTTLGYALLTDGSLYAFSTTSGASFGGVSCTAGVWTLINYTMPAGETLEQVAAFGGNSGGGGNPYDAPVVILRSTTGKLYQVGTYYPGNPTLGFPTGGTWASPVYVTGSADFTAISCMYNFGSDRYLLSGVKSNGDLWLAATAGANWGSQISWQGISGGWLSPVWSIQNRNSSSVGTPIYTGIKTDGLYYFRAGALSAGAAFSQINYGSVTPNPIYNPGSLPYSLQSFNDSPASPVSLVLIP